MIAVDPNFAFAFDTEGGGSFADNLSTITSIFFIIELALDVLGMDRRSPCPRA